jgi:hypothetical protein
LFGEVWAASVGQASFKAAFAAFWNNSLFGERNSGNLAWYGRAIPISGKQRDVIFVRSWALKHYIRTFEGSRYVIVLATSQHLFEWIEHFGAGGLMILVR